jgi:hypothetical protein
MSVVDPTPPALPAPILMGCYTQTGYQNTLSYFWSAPQDTEGNPISVNKYKLSVLSELYQDYSYILDGSVTSYRILNLSSTLTYTGTISASIDDGVTWGQEAQYTPTKPLIIPTQGPASATALRRDDKTIVDVSWEPPVPAPDFIGFYKVTAQSTNPYDPLRGWSTTNFDDLTAVIYDLNPDSSYDFKVEVVNAVGSSPPTYTQIV